MSRLLTIGCTLSAPQMEKQKLLDEVALHDISYVELAVSNMQAAKSAYALLFSLA